MSCLPFRLHSAILCAGLVFSLVSSSALKANDLFGRAFVNVSACTFTPSSVGSDQKIDVLAYASPGIGIDIALDRRNTTVLFTELGYQSKGGKVISGDQFNTGVQTSYSSFLHYLQLNAFMAFQYERSRQSNHYVYIGPGIQYFLSGTNRVEQVWFGQSSTSEVDLPADRYSDIHISIVLGAESNYHISKSVDLFAGLRLEYALTGLNSSNSTYPGSPSLHTIAAGLYGGVRVLL